ncbi:MAG TPA: LysM peptidoglycan-binding domain-containing protein [Anaerolineales bacterium]|nr:LysM peptidoglycan-binding domain-containing protein [Anaerolineales bacterium]
MPALRRWATIGLLWTLAACVEVAAPASPGATATLLPWHTPTSTPSATRLLPTQEATVELAPSPTPLTHIVQARETLLTIAAQYGVTLDALQALNPDVNPNLLSIGQALLIPGPGGEPITSLLPTATPIPLDFAPVRCAPTATGGLTCLTSVRNPSQETLEGLSARIELLDSEDKVLASADAFAPLNLLPAGEVMPLAVYFPPPAPAASGARAVDLDAFPANQVEDRFRPLTIETDEETRGAHASSWTIRGAVQVRSDAGGPTARLLVLAVGFGAQDEVVGYAVWESPEALGPGETVNFVITVLSLGSPIEKVRLLGEALAAPSP